VATRTIAAVGEFAFLARILPQLTNGPDTIIGPGHDCAVIRCGDGRYLFTIDALVEGTHFRRQWLSPRQLGRKSFLVNASDAAAMGGRPRFCVVGMSAPPTYPARDLANIEVGIAAAATECGADVVGGNLARARQLSITIALVAEAPRRTVSRAGAQPGDRVYVTGTLGDAGAGVRVLRAGRRRRSLAADAHAVRRFREPTPRLRAGQLLVASGIVSAMIDVSDGLIQDLGHVCSASNVGAVIHATNLPVSAAYRTIMRTDPRLALSGGEDYELLCTVPERNVTQLERQRAHLGCPLTWIGAITRGRRIKVVDAAGRPMSIEAGGYDHFRGSR
jgi:thiamine-monophosphate kinase